MTTLNIIEIIFAVAILATCIIIYLSWFTVSEGTYAVINSYGRFKRIAGPGFGFKNPLSETIFKRISTQNQSMEIEFTATTLDQANVDFKAMLLYATADNNVETLKKAAFKFQNEAHFMQALIRSVEASIRAYVATKKQNQVLGIRNEITDVVKTQLDINLNDWGYKLIDLQINDILFDEAIMRSMAQVVSSENMKLAAYNEGEAKMIKILKEAEAEKAAIVLKSEAMAKNEEIMADAMLHSSNKLKQGGLDFSYMALLQWIDGMKHIAQHGEGNVLFFDGSVDGVEKTMKQMSALNKITNHQH